jgi:hypothetical protein
MQTVRKVSRITPDNCELTDNKKIRVVCEIFEDSVAECLTLVYNLHRLLLPHSRGLGLSRIPPPQHLIQR